ncbi:hypothetical protein PLEOSDRAFT_1013941, partial [Pleurotus ostreatus PC15]
IKKEKEMRHRSAVRSMLTHKFPPPPPSPELKDQICEDFCNAMSPRIWEESACLVCAQLRPKSKLSDVGECPEINLNLLKRPAVTRMERHTESDDINEMTEPVVLANCKTICTQCEASLRNSNMPKLALANGLWLGDVPEELLCLTFAEKLLVARVRHNSCVVRVASGRVKMAANAILFENPTSKVYD